MSPTQHSFSSTHIRSERGGHLSWCVSETCKALILKRNSSNTAWTWWMIFPFENFSRLVESASSLPARMEIWYTVYTFKGFSIIPLMQTHVLIWGSWPGIQRAERVNNTGAWEHQMFDEAPMLPIDIRWSSLSAGAAHLFAAFWLRSIVAASSKRGRASQGDPSVRDACCQPCIWWMVNRGSTRLAHLQTFFLTSFTRLVFACLI